MSLYAFAAATERMIPCKGWGELAGGDVHKTEVRGTVHSVRFGVVPIFWPYGLKPGWWCMLECSETKEEALVPIQVQLTGLTG